MNVEHLFFQLILLIRKFNKLSQHFRSVMHSLCDRKTPIIIIFLVFIPGFLASSGILISQLLRKLADQDPTVYYAAYVMLPGLVDMIVTCFHMLKIASDGNFYLLLEKNYKL